MKTLKMGGIDLKIAATRQEMGKAAANDVRESIRFLLEAKDEINIVFAAAPSQNEVLEELSKLDDIEWNRINAFHMDEYMGATIDDSFSFANYLRDKMFSRVPFKSVNYIKGNEDVNVQLRRYTELLAKNPVSIVLMGIGENGHIAFNDPSNANFFDEARIKTVELDKKCRMQQVHDGCFPTLEAVPEKAFTLTIPELLRPRYIFCTAPSKLKAQAIKDTVEGPITTACPASVLRIHSGTVCLYTDQEGASLLRK